MPEVAPLGTSGISDIQPQTKAGTTTLQQRAQEAGWTPLPGGAGYRENLPGGGWIEHYTNNESIQFTPSGNVFRSPTQFTNIITTPVSQVRGTGGTFASEGKPAAPTTRTIESGGIRTTTDVYGNVLSREVAPIQLPASELARRTLSPEERQALGRASPGTITDIGRAKAAGYITEQEASKIEMLRSGTAQFASEQTFKELAANTPAYYTGAKGTLVNPQFKSGQEQLDYLAEAARQSIAPQPGHAMIQPSPSVFVDPKYGLMIRSDLPSAQPGMPRELQPRITTPASDFYTYPLYKPTSDFTKWVSSGLEGFTGYTREQSLFSKIVVGAGSGLAAIPEGLAAAGIGAEAIIRNYKQAPALVGAGFVSTVGGLEKGFTERPIETTSGFLAQLFAGKVASKVPVEKLPTIGIGKPKGVIVEVGEVPISPKTGFEPEVFGPREVGPGIGEFWAGKTAAPGKTIIKPHSVSPASAAKFIGISTLPAIATAPKGFDIYAGEARIKETTVKQRELMGTPEGTLGDLTFEQSIRQPVATLYIKPPASSIGDIMNAFTGQIEYIKSPEGSFMKIKPTGTLTTTKASVFDRLRLGFSQKPTAQEAELFKKFKGYVSPVARGEVETAVTTKGGVQSLTNEDIRGLTYPVFRRMGIEPKSIDIWFNTQKEFAEAGHPQAIGLSNKLRREVHINIYDTTREEMLQTIGHEVGHQVGITGSTELGITTLRKSINEATAYTFQKDFIKTFNEYYGTSYKAGVGEKTGSLGHDIGQGLTSRVFRGVEPESSAPTPIIQARSALSGISNYVRENIRIERKLSLEPATISRTTTQARKALPEVTWDIEMSKEAPRPGKPMEYDIYGGMVKGKGMQPKEPLVSGIPERLQLTTRQVSDLDVYLSMARKERAAPKAEPLAPKETFVSQATIDLSESVRTALEEPGIKGERRALFDVATQLKPKMVDIQNVIPPRSPVTIETKVKQHQAVGLAEKMAKDLQGLGIAAEARGTRVIQKGRPADVIGNIEYFDQKKIDMYNLPYDKLSMDRFNMYPNIAMSGQYKFVGAAGDTGILGKFYGNNFIDSPLMGLDIVGITEPRRRHRPLYSPDYVPIETPSPFIIPYPGTAPAPSPKPTRFPTPYPDIFTPTIPDMGFDIGKPPQIPLVDYERKKRKKLRKGKGGYFQTFRATPLIEPFAGLKDMFKAPAKKTYKKSKKGRR